MKADRSVTNPKPTLRSWPRHPYRHTGALRRRTFV